jgi:hypothetical protein
VGRGAALRSTHHTLLHEADEWTKSQWEAGFYLAADYVAWAPAELMERVYEILKRRGDWVTELGWDYAPVNEGLVHGIYGIIGAGRLSGQTATTDAG